MALTGTYRKLEHQITDESLQESRVTYPQDLPEEHPDYEKRGTTQTVQTPVNEVVEIETYENSYVIITGTSIEKIFGGGFSMGYAYRVYASEQDKIDDDTNFILNESDFINYDLELDTPALVRAYDHLKTKPECINLVNA